MMLKQPEKLLNTRSTIILLGYRRRVNYVRLNGAISRDNDFTTLCSLVQSNKLSQLTKYRFFSSFFFLSDVALFFFFFLSLFYFRARDEREKEKRSFAKAKRERLHGRSRRSGATLTRQAEKIRSHLVRSSCSSARPVEAISARLDTRLHHCRKQFQLSEKRGNQVSSSFFSEVCRREVARRRRKRDREERARDEREREN